MKESAVKPETTAKPRSLCEELGKILHSVSPPWRTDMRMPSPHLCLFCFCEPDIPKISSPCGRTQ